MANRIHPQCVSVLGCVFCFYKAFGYVSAFSVLLYLVVFSNFLWHGSVFGWLVCFFSSPFVFLVVFSVL